MIGTNRYIINLTLGFLLQQISRFGQVFDWTKFDTEVDEFTRAHVPGTSCDNMAVAIVKAATKAAHQVLGDSAHFDRILEQLLAGDLAGALVTLRQMLEGIWVPAAAHDRAFATTPQRHLANDLVVGHDDLAGTPPEGALDLGTVLGVTGAPAPSADPTPLDAAPVA